MRPPRVFTKLLHPPYDLGRYLAHNRAVMTVNGTYRDEHCTVDYQERAVLMDGRRLVLTRKEFELLALLSRNAGQIVPRDVLLMQVWGYSQEIRTRTLDVHIRRLRKKFGSFGEIYIETIFGIGYRFQPYQEPQQFHSYRDALPLSA